MTSSVTKEKKAKEFSWNDTNKQKTWRERIPAVGQHFWFYFIFPADISFDQLLEESFVQGFAFNKIRNKMERKKYVSLFKDLIFSTSNSGGILFIYFWVTSSIENKKLFWKIQSDLKKINKRTYFFNRCKMLWEYLMIIFLLFRSIIYLVLKQKY